MSLDENKAGAAAVDPADFNTVVDAVVALQAGGGGFTPVTCLLARDATIDVREVGNYNVLWDALYDNIWDLNTLEEIPAGLGLGFDFDGSSSLVAPTEAGVWTFSYFGLREPDDLWCGTLALGLGLNLPWVQQTTDAGLAVGTPYLSSSLTTPLPAGAQITHQVAATDVARSLDYTVTQVYLSIVRHA